MENNPKQSFQYKAFISYSHRDAKWARWLHNALENYKIHAHLIGQNTPAGKIPDKLSPIFLDRAELASATDLGTLLTKSLEGSWCQIVICSPTAAQSHWVNEEILTFKRLGRADRIFSLIVDGEPYASGSDQPELECFPPALRFQLDKNGELCDLPAEPIAADARRGKDGKTNALIKIIAGMLDVGFDALKQRELQRKHRRLAWLTASACLGMILASGLAINAVLARNEAEVQRARAQIEAETASRTASFMVSLFSVSDPSEARGNSITAREILDKGALRIETELSNQPVIQSNLMHTIGKVYTALGLYQQARNLLGKTVEQRSQLFTEGQLEQLDLATSQGALANVMTELAELEQAEQYYASAIEITQNNTPVDNRLLAELIAGQAEAYYRLGKYSDAGPLLQRVVALNEQAFGVPSLEVADSIQQVGLNFYDLGDSESALEYLGNSLAMFYQVLNEQPHPLLAENIGNIAYLLHSSMQFEEAEIKYREALAMYRTLLGDAHPTVAMAALNLAFLYHDFGRYEQALATYQESLDTLIQVYGASHPSIAKSMNNMAYLLYDMGELAQASSMMDKVVAMASQELGSEHIDVARYLSTQARWLADAQEYVRAEALHRRALAIKQAVLEPGHPDIGISQFDLAEALTGIGQAEEATRLAEQSVALLSDAMGSDHWHVAVANLALGNAYLKLDRLDQAEPILRQSYLTLSSTQGVQPSYIRKALHRLIALNEKQQDVTEENQYQQLLSQLNNSE